MVKRFAFFLWFSFVIGLFLLASAACRDNRSENAAPSNNAVASSSSPVAEKVSSTVGEPTSYDPEIARLEKEAEKNPGNAEATSELARAYVRRGNALRQAGRLREAMLDYQKAQRYDGDNDEAVRNAAEIAPQVEGTPTGEYGEPAPLPITPNVTGSDEKPSPTPKKGG
jgi:tetratricopeptide (TPR) repeat protein